MPYTALALEPDDGALRIEITTTDPDLLNIYDELDVEERVEFAEKAFKIGSIVLRDSATISKADYVERVFERMQAKMAAELERLFGEDGRLEHAVEDAVGEEGQMARVLKDIFGPEGKLHHELEAEFGEDGGRLYRLLNPSDERTPLGQFRKSLEERFDPDREGSLLWELKDQLRNGFEEIKHGLGIKEAVEEEAEKGTQKGFKFEDYVGGLLETAADPFGDEIVPTGSETGSAGNKVGDFVCHLNPENVNGVARTIVVEVKDRYKPLTGKNSLHHELNDAIDNRDADFAIAVVKSEHAEKWGPLHYVAPQHLYVSVDQDEDEHLALEVGYRLARTLCSVRATREGKGVDVETVAEFLGQIERQFDIVRMMKSNLTTASNKIGDVKNHIDSLKDGVLQTVDELRERIGCEEEE